MPEVITVSHPLVEHSLSVLRDKRTLTAEFRQHASIVSKILMVEATRILTLTETEIETPLGRTTGARLLDDVVVAPVLRAGLAMLFAMQDFLPSVAVGFIGLERDEKTARAREYYQKMPNIFASNKVLVIDPMLATGGSMVETVAALKNQGARHIRLVCIVAAPEGIERVTRDHPDVSIITAAIDERLNDQKFILPGLGDFGDRYFGT